MAEEKLRDVCPMCGGGKLSPAKVRVAIRGLSMGSFDGYRCSSCGEEFLREHSLKGAHEEIVRSGLFGIAKHKSSQGAYAVVPMMTESGTSVPVFVGQAILEVSGTSMGQSVITTRPKSSKT